MTAVLAPPQFLDQPAVVGDRVHCRPAHGFPFNGRVEAIDPLAGQLQVHDEQQLIYRNVNPASVQVWAVTR